MTATDLIAELEPLGTDSYRKILFNHGVKEPLFGVKIEEMKKISKRIKKDYQLALDLYDTGIYDAMYLAGLIADDAKMTQKDLRKWANRANCPTLSEYTVPWVAAESNHGLELAREWIDSKKELVAAAGWATFGGIASLTPDTDLDLTEFKKLLKRVGQGIHDQPNRVRYVMNSFMIAIGTYVVPLTELVLATATKVGEISVMMGNTACKVPAVAEHIEKTRARGGIGKKRKTVKC